MPVAKEGLPFIWFLVAAGTVLMLFPFRVLQVLSVLSFALAIFAAFFFRDPERTIRQDPFWILAPGDGRILEVTEEASPYLPGKFRVVKIFLSIFDIHVQRSPISGRVKSIEYKKGKFLDARDPLASLENENNTILIENERTAILVKQIAGFIARRIACWVRPGQSVRAGERVGLIRFGSQVDIFVPQDVELCVAKGDSVAGGVSVVAILKENMKVGGNA